MKDVLYQLAVTLTPGTGSGQVNIPTSSGDEVLAGILGIVYFVAGVVAVVVIIIAGFMFVTAAGDPTTVTKAKNAILYAVVGLVVVALAFVITQFVMGRF